MKIQRILFGTKLAEKINNVLLDTVGVFSPVTIQMFDSGASFRKVCLHYSTITMHGGNISCETHTVKVKAVTWN